MEMKTEPEESSDQLLGQNAVINSDKSYENNSDVEQEIEFLQMQNSKFPIVLVEDLNTFNDKMRNKSKKYFLKKKRKKKSGPLSSSSDTRESLRFIRKENGGLIQKENDGCLIKKENGGKEYARNLGQRDLDSTNESFVSSNNLCTTYEENSDNITSETSEVNLLSASNETIQEASLNNNEEDGSVVYFKCNLCEYLTTRKEKLKVHILIHETKELSIQSTKEFHCPDCDFKTKYKPNLKVHFARRHSGTKRYCCSLCSYGSYFQNRLKAHIQVHTKRKKSGKIRSFKGTANYELYSDDCSEDSDFDLKEQKRAETYSNDIDLKESRRSGRCSNFVSSKQNYFEASSSDDDSTEVPLTSRSQDDLGTSRSEDDLGASRSKDDLEASKSQDDLGTSRSQDNIETSRSQDDIGTLRPQDDLGASRSQDDLGCVFKCTICEFKSSNAFEIKEHSNSHALDNDDNGNKTDKEILSNELESSSNIPSNGSNFISKEGVNSFLKRFKYKCPICNFKTHLKKCLRKHELTHPLFKCSFCKFESHVKNTYIHHLRIHSNKVFSCFKCKFQTFSDQLFVSHLNNHFPQEKKMAEYECSKCEFSTATKGNLKRHFLCHSKSKLFKCKNCQLRTNYRSVLKRHTLWCLDQKNSDDWNGCEDESTSGEKLNRDRSEDVSTNHELYSDDCSEDSDLDLNEKKRSETYSNDIDLKERRRSERCSNFVSSKHNYFEASSSADDDDESTSRKKLNKNGCEDVSTSRKRWKCEKCDSFQSSKEELNIHLAMHSKEALYKCSKCSFSTCHKRRLKTHFLTNCKEELKEEKSEPKELDDETRFNSSATRFKSELDDRTTQFNSELNDTTQFNSELKDDTTQFNSELNDNTTQFNSELNDTTTQFNSELNDNTTQFNSELKDNTTQYKSSDRWFRCSKCRFKSCHKGNLQRHLRTHSDSKLYNCAKCDFSTNYKYLFKRHNLSKHRFATKEKSALETRLTTHEKDHPFDENIALSAHEYKQERIWGIMQQSDEGLVSNNALESVKRAHKIIPLELIKQEIEFIKQEVEEFEMENVQDDFVIENITNIENIAFENISSGCVALESDCHYRDLATLGIEKEGSVLPENTENYQELTALESVEQQNIWSFESKIPLDTRKIPSMEHQVWTSENKFSWTTHFNEPSNESSCSQSLSKVNNFSTLKTHLLTPGELDELKFTERNSSFHELAACETSEQNHEMTFEAGNKGLFHENSEHTYELSFNKF